MTEEQKIDNLINGGWPKLENTYHQDITLPQLLKALPKMPLSAREKRVIKSRLDHNKRKNDKLRLAWDIADKNQSSFKKNPDALKLLHLHLNVPKVQADLRRIDRDNPDDNWMKDKYLQKTIDRRINDKDLRKIVRALPNGNKGETKYFRDSFGLDGIGSVFESDYAPGPHPKVRNYLKNPGREFKDEALRAGVLIGLGAPGAGAMAYFLKRKGRPLKSWKSITKIGAVGLAPAALFGAVRIVRRARARLKQDRPLRVMAAPTGKTLQELQRKKLL